MYTLYYLNRNHQLGTIKVASLDSPVLIPEDLVFCNFRSGVKFIKEPHECIGFTDTERLLMASEFTDIEMLKHYDYRRQNTFLNASCTIEQSDKDPRASCCDEEVITPPQPTNYTIYGTHGTYTCYKKVVNMTAPVYGTVVSKKLGSSLVIGDTLYSDLDATIPVNYTFMKLDSQAGYAVLVNGVITEFIAIGSACDDGIIVPEPTYRYLGEVQLTGRSSDGVITLGYVSSTGQAHQQSWTVGGNGEELYYAFGVGECIVETSLGLDGGTLIANIWDDGISCII